MLVSTSIFGGYLEESDVAVGTIMKSHHFKPLNYNEAHNGIYFNINRWSFGRYTNSINKQSTVITHNTSLYKKESFEIKSVVGFATGYRDMKYSYGDILPMVGLSAQYMYFKGVLIPEAIVFGVEIPLN
jgi:hypothetical protein